MYILNDPRLLPAFFYLDLLAWGEKSLCVRRKSNNSQRKQRGILLGIDTPKTDDMGR